jgi:hypothetical protein
MCRVSNNNNRKSADPPGATGGWWAVINTTNQQLTEVRHVIDTVYTALGFCPVDACALTVAQRQQMVDFALRQLVLPDQVWLHALSPEDQLCYVSRPDHGTTGAYDAWASTLFQALTALDDGFNRSLPFFLATAAVTHEGPYGQAHQITLNNRTAYKTKAGFTRYLANNGGGFAEAIITTVFGYAPTYEQSSRPPRDAWAGRDRHLNGTLLNLRDAHGQYWNVYLTPTGAEYVPANT